MTQGFQWAAGFTAPQLIVQVCPMYWGLALSWTREWKQPMTAIAIQLGPVAVKFSWGGYAWERHHGGFKA